MMKLLACFGNVWRFELIEVHSGRERSDWRGGHFGAGRSVPIVCVIVNTESARQSSAHISLRQIKHIRWR